ncbi:hypothetical protein CDAR_582251 [Caerostris darwini]|uniref:Uncharacterized protein n=1 Tax=Caerostris darwini TaxID=1538125 RepID=A0AAV4RHF9_9ARAC|nr:hypothetical protein CDAR_582251 [Caerostris darwini]
MRSSDSASHTRGQRVTDLCAPLVRLGLTGDYEMGHLDGLPFIAAKVAQVGCTLRKLGFPKPGMSNRHQDLLEEKKIINDIRQIQAHVIQNSVRNNNYLYNVVIIRA